MPIFINHLKLTFVATKPPPSQVFEQVALPAAEEGREHFLAFVIMASGSLLSFGLSERVFRPKNVSLAPERVGS